MTLHILLIEDDAIDRKAVHRALRKQDVSLVDATTLAEAKIAVMADAFDCVLLDWHLPDGEAPTMLEHLRVNMKAEPVVVLTGMSQEHLAETALKAGAQDYLVKGEFDTQSLMRAVKYAIERARALLLEARLAHADRLASVGRLAAGIAHEVNNPATFILGNLEFLRSGNLGDEERAEVIDQCELGMRRITSVMRQLGGFSRLSAGQPTWVRLSDVVEQAVKMAKPSMRHRASLKITTEDTPEIAADRSALVGVAVNLLVNAQNAIDAAGSGEHEIRISARQLGPVVVLAVDDTGTGVAPDIRGRIFEPFFSRGNASGAGLGLSICREIARSHRGNIDVGPSELGGACFTVTFPLDTGLTVARLRQETFQLPEELSVLVVDDEPLLRKALTRMLGNFDVIEAESAPEALARLHEQDMDIVLCDLMMPNQTGSDLFEQAVRQIPGIGKRFVFITGGAVTPATETFIENVDAPVLLKPFTAEELHRAITGCLANLREAS